MKRIFHPKEMYHTCEKIDLLALKAQGIQALIIDLDNTLASCEEVSASVAAHRFIAEAKRLGFTLVMISNNVRTRVEPFAAELGVHAVWFAIKPTPLGFWRARKFLADIPRHKIANIGDQLLTDVFGGKLMGFHTILVKPLIAKDNIYASPSRLLEKLVAIDFEAVQE
ncbi:MAG: YqeG family HAD IIIA-type phosphatase [Culicoidibacterales bacterium]